MADEANLQSEWDSVQAEREGSQTNPPPETPPAQVDENKPKPTEAPQTEAKPVDPYEGLHPDVRAKLERFDQLATSQSQLLNELREAKGRIGALQSEWAKSQRVAQAQQPTQAQIAAAAKDPEEWEALKKDFPEWGTAIAKFVDARLGAHAGGQNGPTAEQIEQLVAQRTENATTAVVKQLNESLVTMKHPNWRIEVNTPEFANWARVQSPEVQALANSSNGFDAIRMLDLYAETKARPVAAVKEDRRQKLAAAASTAKQGTAAVVTKSFEDMSPQEQWDYLARERDKAAA